MMQKQISSWQTVLGLAQNVVTKKYGDQCEKCGSMNATDLINPKSTITGETPIMKSETLVSFGSL
jgi:methionyl-tRNA synthetase